MDKVVRALVCDGEISVTLIESTELCNYAAHIHLLNKTTSEVLGRFLTAITFFGAALKEESGQVSASLKSGGLGGNISVSADYDLHIRGTIDEPNANVPLRDGRVDIPACVGKQGTLTVIRNDGYSSPFVGTSELKSGNIEEDFSYYFAQSEQIPTVIKLGMITDEIGDVSYAGGIFFQTMPFASEESIRRIEEVFSATDVEHSLKELGLEGYLRTYFGEVPVTERFPEYHCNCSRDYISSILLSLGKAELKKIVQEQGKVSVHCHYCNTDYEFDDAEIEALFPETT